MTQSRKSLCLDTIRQQILSLALPPGSDLDEAKLGAEFGMSRTPLREILQKLAGEGFVDITQNKGAKVVSMDMAMMRSFFQTAPLIYANIARLACENRSLPQLKALKTSQQHFKKATLNYDPAQAAIHNHQFHQIIGDMSQNCYLIPSLQRMLIDHTRLSQTFYRPASPAESALVRQACDQHDDMIAAIEDQQAEAAVALTLQHWALSQDRMERFVRPDLLPVELASPKETAHAI
jgi:DNA-binding GntR family transcriptional regulator